MTMRKLQRKTAQLGSLSLFAALDVPTGEPTAVGDPVRVQAAMDTIRSGLEHALATDSTLHGWRAQNLFAAVVVALDGCLLLKEEDEGVTYYDGERVKLPDWRLTLRDGRNLLVEVKAKPPSAGAGEFRISKGEVSGLRRYSELVGDDVYVAVFWSALHVWSLLPLNALGYDGVSQYAISFEEAMKRSEMGSLGDRWLGLVPPLAVRFLPDPGQPNEADETGTANFTIGAVQLWCGGKRMETDEERALVWFLAQAVAWDGSEKHVLTSDERHVEYLSFELQPEEPVPGQGFALVGALSELYSRRYNMLTVSPEGVTALGIDADPGQLVRLVPTDMQSERLPLWHLLMQPS